MPLQLGKSLSTSPQRRPTGDSVFTTTAAIGRNVEILRVLDALQLSSEFSVSTPVNWKDGDQVITSQAVGDDAAKERFPQAFTTLKPYLRVAARSGE